MSEEPKEGEDEGEDAEAEIPKEETISQPLTERTGDLLVS